MTRLAGHEPADAIGLWTLELSAQFIDDSGEEQNIGIGRVRAGLVDPEVVDNVFFALADGDHEWSAAVSLFDADHQLMGPFERLLIVDDIEIAEEHRRKGWGTALLAWALAEISAPYRGDLLMAAIPDLRQPWSKKWLERIGLIPSVNSPDLWIRDGEIASRDDVIELVNTALKDS